MPKRPGRQRTELDPAFLLLVMALSLVAGAIYILLK